MDSTVGDLQVMTLNEKPANNTWLDYSMANATTDPNATVVQDLILPPIFIHAIESFIIPMLFLIIFAIGLIGNGTLIYIVARNKNLWNTPNIFIVSLAAGDLLLILVAVPFNATIFTFTYWPYGYVMCKVNEFMQTLSLGVSVFTLVALSGDRYMAIVFPMSKHTGSPKLRTALIAAGIWILSGSLAIMDLVQTEITQVDIPPYYKPICFSQSPFETDPYARFRTVFRSVVYFAIPVFIICLFYILMAFILFRSSKNLPGDSSYCHQARRQLEARKNVAKVVLSFVAVFIVCWAPYHFYRIWYYFIPGEFSTFWLIFKILSFCMAFLNSCINPFALFFLSKQFRGYYNKYLFCCCPCTRNQQQNAEYTTTLYQFKNAGRPSNSVTLITSNTVC